eukprot:TRINITY_DN5848_c0_g1_i3.p1 TRINITY_DN5848_c0_g1~~TRINITY_DN5848_c0_g1_i3.p1  ORF type:complete len:845 (-),score=211.65 TRINITY_DN5848_c0_g1_i3:45-2579(-)
MGLGKTLQTIAFLSGLLGGKHVKNALIVCPLSVVSHWCTEMTNWLSFARVFNYNGTAVRRQAQLDAIKADGGICLTTYGMIAANAEKLCPDSFQWDYVILDEGHKIKNPHIRISKSLRQIRARHRLLLTGTPVQNNLQELWSLFDYVSDGQLLGTAQKFRVNFESPILAAQDRDASPEEIAAGARARTTLSVLIEPQLLRREKTEVGPLRLELKEQTCQKTELTVWIPLSEAQEKLYRLFLESSEVRQILNKSMYPLAALTVLKKICDHPQLLQTEMKMCGTLDNSMEECLAGLSLEQQSSKLRFLSVLMQNLRKEGHRTLIFSQSTRMLDRIQLVLQNQKFTMFRIDGSTKGSDRQKLISAFNNDASINCFLLTTQTGGLGITLTGADRVIIFDPAWNPAVDSQAVDRSYRIGQTSDVCVYRLITCSTIEEKIYRKQVYKGSLMKTTIDQENTYRYFTKDELRELFVLGDTKNSQTQMHLAAVEAAGNHTASHEQEEDTLAVHKAYLQTLDIFGLSDHGKVFLAQSAEVEDDYDVTGLAEEAARDIAENAVNAENERRAIRGTPASASAMAAESGVGTTQKRRPVERRGGAGRKSILNLMQDTAVEDCSLAQLDLTLSIANELERYSSTGSGDNRDGVVSSTGLDLNVNFDSQDEDTAAPAEQPEFKHLSVTAPAAASATEANGLPNSEHYGQELAPEEVQPKQQPESAKLEMSRSMKGNASVRKSMLLLAPVVISDSEDSETETSGTDVAVSSSVCAGHRDMPLPRTVKVSGAYICTRCRCHCTRDELLQYNELLDAMESSSSSTEQALQNAVAALQICNDDVWLHLRAQQLAHSWLDELDS